MAKLVFEIIVYNNKRLSVDNQILHNIQIC
jgi:hypothetical protein